MFRRHSGQDASLQHPATFIDYLLSHLASPAPHLSASLLHFTESHKVSEHRLVYLHLANRPPLRRRYIDFFRGPARTPHRGSLTPKEVTVTTDGAVSVIYGPPPRVMGHPRPLRATADVI